MKIHTQRDYIEALDRANRLRGNGQDAESSAELAAIDASIHAYAQLTDDPAATPGRPAPSSRRER
ncbi:MAG TPA: hypothetical protein VES39_00495 [Rhodospirillales bacterium]|nr:hypothetical protein [Rhodospirillales bacterium]